MVRADIERCLRPKVPDEVLPISARSTRHSTQHLGICQYNDKGVLGSIKLYGTVTNERGWHIIPAIWGKKDRHA